MKIKLKRAQMYIAADGATVVGKKGDIVDAKEDFCKLLPHDAFEKAKENEDDKTKAASKPLEQMNKADLIKLAAEKGLEQKPAELQKLTNAQIVDLIKAAGQD